MSAIFTVQQNSVIQDVVLDRKVSNNLLIIRVLLKMAQKVLLSNRSDSAVQPISIAKKIQMGMAKGQIHPGGVLTFVEMKCTYE